MADDRWSALSEAFRAFAHTTQDYSELVETIARKLCELVSDACIVSLAAEGSGLSAFAASAHDPATSSRLRSALATRELDPSSVAAAHLDIRSVISLPLEVPGRRLGEVSLFRYLPDSAAFTEDDRTFARTIADHAAITIVNAELIAELQRAQSRSSTFVSLIENSNEMIGFCDLEGNVKFINRAGRELLGIDDDDQKEYTLRDTIYSEEGVQRVLKIGEINSYRGEGQMRHQKTGEPIATMVSTFIVRDRDGAPMAIATVQRDLRETKRLEEELRQAQKMEALGRLAGGVAHDFNNLLTVILSYCSILTKQLPRGSRQVQDIEQIDRAAQRAAELTKQLLAFSRRQVLELRPLELGATVRAMDGMIRRLIGEDIELRILTMPDEDYVLTDPGQVEQVVMNLAVNARDAMKGGGTLTLETTRSGDYMVLEVRDTGVGIAAETRPHLFEPFFTTKDAGKGTGLGLSTVMGIVQQSGGRVTVDSTLGHGSTFRVFLPAVQRPDVEPGLPTTWQPIAMHAGARRILVVEDEPEVRVLICSVLRDAGYDVIAANDGAHALDVAAHVKGEIDLLLTDVIMPKLSGRQLATRFLELRPRTRVLYMSGYTDDKLGVLDPDLDLIEKPLTPEALVSRVRAALT